VDGFPERKPRRRPPNPLASHADYLHPLMLDDTLKLLAGQRLELIHEADP
jgi:hypothetical protein